jgi:acetyl-CoA carboxylase biotin carboxyl carrier protein
MAAKKPSIDIQLIRDLANLLNETDLHEIEVEEGELRLRLSRAGSVISAPAVSHSIAVAPPVGAPAGSASPVPEEAVAPESGTPITSPMVGTAYMSPAPDAAAFISVGDTIKVGQTILIVEAMKTMNQIPATHAGVVTAINVEDGQPVEFGETLITLK